MRDFHYSRATTIADARSALADVGTALLAGGTTLIDLTKCGVAEPERVVDITGLPGLRDVSVRPDGAEIGALATMRRVAEHSGIRSGFPAVAEALEQSASPQLRAMATIGGNLMQRTRCAYFRDPLAFPACNKRRPGSGCSAIGGETRNHAILGASEACIATYPGDLAVALVALDAEIHLGERRVGASDFFLLPGATPEREHPMAPGEIVTAVTIPASPAARRSTYLKVRDRQSYEFAAASAAVGFDLEEDGLTVRDIRIALGGVATKPWRCHSVERALIGRPLDEATIRDAAMLSVEGAVARGANAVKTTLAPRVVARAILSLGGL